MDRPIPRRNPWPRRAAIVVGVAALLLVAYVVARPASQRSLAVEGSRVTTGKVVRGQFDDVIQVRGRVTPLRTTFVDTASGGQVEAILVEDGAMVERGQLLVELSNTALQLDLISREAQITEQLNLLRGLELQQAQSRLEHEREVVEVRYQIKRLTRQLATAKEMVESGASARSEIDDMQDELEYFQHRLRVQTTTRAEADRLQKAQVVQMRAAAEKLEANLAIARKNLDSLKVKAPVSGKLSAFTLEVGQSLAAGDRIAQIDDPERYKVVADIDEFYLSRVDIGQKADYPQGGATYQLEVAKIRPQVQNGQFQVELVFVGEAPAAVRRGQTAQVRLQLGQPSEAVIVPNAAFYNDTGGAWVFVVSSDHSHAVRRNVRLGRRNPQQIEVLDGLSPGEEIVTSPYTNYLDMDRLELTR
ncbi:MAG: efflux RND transporter periplasmic adaptor subunit [Kofleriaceae bacterium]|nr:MAG: efflux RND transporter periplasmic adaptor subunit [Kofleriaceae bacterium]MBZ0230791.1 efflux RND transporter periplasmic adaptor subunit [Kofleriaceae bacterium]